MTRSDALSIIDDLPKSLQDIAMKTETEGPQQMIDMLNDAGIDGEAFLLALREDLIDALSDFPYAEESLEKQLALLDKGPLAADTEIDFGKYEGETVQEIADEDEGYAEWAAENLDDKPRLAAAFGEALQ